MAGVALLLVACVSDEDADNIILDPKGVVVKLQWTNSSAKATDGADLDLIILKDNGPQILESYNNNAFEEIKIDNGDLANGTYDIEVYVDNIVTPTDYTVTVEGIETKKAYSLKYVDVKVSNKRDYLSPASFTVGGNKYTVFQ